MYGANVKFGGDWFKDLTAQFKSTMGARAGFLSNERYPVDESGEEPPLVHDVALWNNNGEGVPARPFLELALLNDEPKWTKLVNNLMGKDNMTMKRIAQRLGEAMRNSIIKSIDSNIPPPNSPFTIAKKGSSRTLIDTGLMRQSVHYEVLKSKEQE